MKRQKGQVIVEFALILPFLLLFICGIIYSGMLFHDYSSLSNIARSAAREAAIMQSEDYSSISSHYSNPQLITGLYRQTSFTIEPSAPNSKDVCVRIKMALNIDFPLLRIIAPETFDIVYYMRKDSPGN